MASSGTPADGPAATQAGSTTDLVPSPAPTPERRTDPAIHEAERVPGPEGAVAYFAELTEAQAVARRKAGLDVVVRGPEGEIDKALARAIKATARRVEEAVGPCLPEAAHLRHAGRMASPHFQQRSRSPGHTFYEDSSGRRARRGS